MASPAFGEVHVSLFVAGAAFGEVHVSLFVAGAAFGEVHVSFLWQAQHVVKFGMIAGAGNVVIFNRICSWRVRDARSTLGGAAGSVLRCLGRNGLGSCSDHARIGRALEMPLQLFSVNFSKIWECNFAWQAQYLVRLQGAACRSAHCK